MPGTALEQVDLDGGVAVGFDGSTNSLRALRIAVDEARRRDTILHIIRAWSIRTTPRPKDFPAGSVPSVEEYSKHVLAETELLVTDEIGTDPPCEIQFHVVHAPTPRALLSASNGADLLVVGHRGHATFRATANTTEHCVRHAHCPVLVVPPDQ